MSKSYDDIINLPHHVSKKRPQMSMADRAAQFSPFAALTGHDAAIRETARLTDDRIDLDEGELEILNMRFQLLFDNLDLSPEVTFTWFKPDARKAGGSYETTHGIVKKIDHQNRLIIMQDQTVIPMDDVVRIELEDEIWI